MIVAFDPVSRDVTIDLEDGSPPFVLPACAVQFKLYSEVVLSALAEGGSIEIGYTPVEEEPYEIVLVPVAPRRWRVQFVQTRPA